MSYKPLANIPKHTIKQSLHYMNLSGVQASIFGTLTTGVFLTGFALHIGAGTWAIGLLNSLPIFTNLWMPLTAFFLAMGFSRKNLKIGFFGLAAYCWLPVMIIPFLAVRTDLKVTLLLGCAGLSAVFCGLQASPWYSWMRDLVPAEVRGRYFAARNILVNAGIMLCGWLGGYFLDLFDKQSLTGFIILFGAAIVFAIFSNLFARKAVAPPRPKVHYDAQELSKFLKPLFNKNFMVFTLFTMSFNVAVNIMGPFLILYCLQSLQMSYFKVSFCFNVIGTIAAIFSFLYWGKACDRFGHRPVAFMSGAGITLSTLAWIFVLPGHTNLVPLINIIGGASWAGFGLAMGNWIFKIAPEGEDEYYYAFYFLTTSLVTLAGPWLGATFLTLTEGFRASFGFVQLDAFKVLCLISFVLRWGSLAILFWVAEPATASVGQVLRILGQVLPSYLPNTLLHPLDNLIYPLWQPSKSGDWKTYFDEPADTKSSDGQSFQNPPEL